MDDINKRTRFLVKTLGPNPNAFAVKTRILVPAVHYVIGTRKRVSKPGFDFIYKVLTTFPEISPRWYILGEGAWNNNGNNDNSELKILKMKNKALKNENEILDRTLKLLERMRIKK